MAQKTEQEAFLEMVREIILEADRADNHQVKQDVDFLKGELMEKEKFYSHLDPYFQQKILYLQQNFPHLFGPFLSNAIKLQIRDSQDEVIEAMYPIIGKLIRKYITVEIEQLGSKIDRQLQNTLSLQAWWDRIVAFVSGEKHSEGVMSKALPFQLEEVFVIANDSGLLLGHYSFNNLIEPDMIAGMLTGIKSFVEQAFMQGSQDLQSLEYDDYKILVNGFHSFYMAFVTKGILNPEVKSRIWDAALDFASLHISHVPADIDREYTDGLSLKLATYFEDFDKK
jgi:hypothetical protein